MLVLFRHVHLKFDEMSLRPQEELEHENIIRSIQTVVFAAHTLLTHIQANNHITYTIYWRLSRICVVDRRRYKRRS